MSLASHFRTSQYIWIILKIRSENFFIHVSIDFYRMFRFIRSRENSCAARNRKSASEPNPHLSHPARKHRQRRRRRRQSQSLSSPSRRLWSRSSPTSYRATLGRRWKPTGPSQSLAGFNTNGSDASSSETYRSGSNVTRGKIFPHTRYSSLYLVTFQLTNTRSNYAPSVENATFNYDTFSS